MVRNTERLGKRYHEYSRSFWMTTLYSAFSDFVENMFFLFCDLRFAPPPSSHSCCTNHVATSNALQLDHRQPRTQTKDTHHHDAASPESVDEWVNENMRSFQTFPHNPRVRDDMWYRSRLCSLIYIAFSCRSFLLPAGLFPDTPYNLLILPHKNVSPFLRVCELVRIHSETFVRLRLGFAWELMTRGGVTMEGRRVREEVGKYDRK